MIQRLNVYYYPCYIKHYLLYWMFNKMAISMDQIMNNLVNQAGDSNQWWESNLAEVSQWEPV